MLSGQWKNSLKQEFTDVFTAHKETFFYFSPVQTNR